MQDHAASTSGRGWTHWLLNPWTWVLVAFALRFGMLIGLPLVGARIAMRTDTGEGWEEHLTDSPGMLKFLQKRVQYRALTEDEIAYDDIGQNIVLGKGFVLNRYWQVSIPGKPTTFAGCGYPLFIAGVYAIFGIGNQLPVYLIQVVLHALAAWFVFESVRRIAGPVGGACGAAFYTFHPMLIWSAVALMSESIALPFSVVLFWLLSNRFALGYQAGGAWLRIVLIGIILAFLAETRSPYSYFGWVVAAFLILEARGKRSWPERFAHAAVFFFGFAAVCAPWVYRNYVEFGVFIPFSTKKGQSSYLTNHIGLVPELGPRLQAGPLPIDIYGPEFMAIPDEMGRDARCNELFLQFVREHPERFLALTGARFLVAVLPLTAVKFSLLTSLAAWYIKGIVLLLVPAALILARRRLWWRLLPWLLFVAYWQTLQSVSGAGLRYRLPADPVWACILGVACGVIAARLWPQTRSLKLSRRFLRTPPALSTP